MIYNLERGATAVEYGLFVALVAAVVIFGVAALGDATLGLFDPVHQFFLEWQPPGGTTAEG